MIEQALYFAIGFLAASLAAIVILPALARRAARLYEARSRLQAPATEKQAIAERDALRAHYAVECARLERRAVLAEQRAIGLRSEGGRQAVSLIALKSDAEAHAGELAAQAAETEALRWAVRELEATLGASQIGLRDVSIQRDRALAAEAESVARVERLEAESSRDRARIAMLGARGEQLESRLDDLGRAARSAAEAAEKAQAGLTADLRAETQRAAELEQRLANAQGVAKTLTEQAAEGFDKGEALERRLAASEAQRAETVIEMGRQLATLADRDAELKAAEAKARELEALIDARERAARASEASASGRAESHTTALMSMEDALKAARAERAALQRENDDLRGRLDAAAQGVGAGEGDAALRAAIERLGREVVRLWAQRGDGQEDQTSIARWPSAAPPIGNVGEDGALRIARSRAAER